MSSSKSTANEKASDSKVATTSSVDTDCSQTKAKTQMTDVNKSVATESFAVNASNSSSVPAKKSRVPQPVNAETTALSLRSSSKSLVQDSRISPGKKISTRPTVSDRRSSLSFAASSSKPPLSGRPPAAYMPSSGAAKDSQSFPTVYIPSSSPFPSGIEPAASAPVIAQSMLTGFRYDPYDRTPPRRKMAAAVTDISAANETSSSLSSMRTTKRRPLFTVGPNGEALVTPVFSSHASWSLPTHGQPDTVTVATSPSHLEADLADFRKVVEAAKGPYDPRRRSESSITRQPYKIAKKLDPSDIEERIQRANCVTHLERLGEPHTRLSTTTDRSIPFCCSEKVEPEAESSSAHMSRQDLQDFKTLESRILPSDIPQKPPPRNPCSSAQELLNPFHTTTQDLKAPDTLASFLPTVKTSQEQPLSKDQVVAATSEDLAFNSLRSFRQGSEFLVNQEVRSNSLPDLRDRSMLMAPSGDPEDGMRGDADSAHSSVPFPIAPLNFSGATSGTMLANTNDSKSDVEAQKRLPETCHLPFSLTKNQRCIKEKALSMFSFRLFMNWPNFLCLAAKVVLVATFVTFMVVALVSIWRTKPYPAPSDLFISSSKTMTSEDGSSNLTMSWVGGQAVGFRVSPSYNLKLDPNEPRPDEIRFLFDWSAEGLGMLSGGERKLVNSMPIPSFEKKLTELVGFLGLFLLIFIVVHKALSFVSKLGHQKENSNLYMTNFLGWFDKGIDWVSLILGVVGSTLIWARATLELLLW